MLHMNVAYVRSSEIGERSLIRLAQFHVWPSSLPIIVELSPNARAFEAYEWRSLPIMARQARCAYQCCLRL